MSWAERREAGDEGERQIVRALERHPRVVEVLRDGVEHTFPEEDVTWIRANAARLEAEGRISRLGLIPPDFWVELDDPDKRLLWLDCKAPSGDEAEFAIREWAAHRELVWTSGYPAYVAFWFSEIEEIRTVPVTQLYPERIVLRREADRSFIRRFLPNVPVREAINSRHASFGVVGRETVKTWPKLPVSESLGLP